MAQKFEPQVVGDLRKLVERVTSLDMASATFGRTYSVFEKHLARLNTPCVEHQPDVEEQVASIAEKFRFHGFHREAAILQALYNKYVAAYSSPEDLHHRLAAVKLLLGLAISPTNYLASLDNAFQCDVLSTAEDDIDWVAHLKDGIVPWSPNFEETDEESSEYSDSNSVQVEDLQGVATYESQSGGFGKHLQMLEAAAAQCKSANWKLELEKRVQHTWWHLPLVRDLPSSVDDEANIALRWEAYQGGQTSIISQYKVVREILWQLDGPHTSVVFAWRDNTLVVNEHVTIASMRPFVFKPLVETFLSYILQLHQLRTFHQHTLEDAGAPRTFAAYAESLLEIVRSVMRRVHEMAALVARQERTMTLLRLAAECSAIFTPIAYACALHARVTLAADGSAICLLAALHREMAQAFAKPQMDIVLALHVDAMCAYARLIETWFRCDRLHDPQAEFPVTEAGDEYALRPSAAAACASSALLQLIESHVVPIGRQMRQLRRLGRLSRLHAEDFSVYEAWRRGVLADVTSDGGAEASSTYETLHQVASSSYAPAERIVVTRMRALLAPLRRRVSDALRRVVVEECALGAHVDALWTVYLFRDDVVGPFYRRAFDGDVWLTHQLRAALVDAHPALGACVSVAARADALDIVYRVAWPIDVVVTADAVRMYRELFAFVLQVKRALHALHQMAYARAAGTRAPPECVRVLRKRLQLLRFGFAAIFSALQHHVLGYVFDVCRDRYQAECAHARDLDALAAAHATFIGLMHRVCARVRDYEDDGHGISLACYLVQKLHKMWLAPGSVHDAELKKMEDGMRACHANITDILSYEVVELL